MKKYFWGPSPTPLKESILGGQKGEWAAVRAQNIRYDLLMVWGDALRLLRRNMCRKISTYVDGGLSGGSGVRRPGSEDPHWRLLFTFTFRFISEPYNKHK